MIEKVPTSRRPEKTQGQPHSEAVSDSGVASTISGMRFGTIGRAAAVLALLGAVSCGRSAISSCEGHSEAYSLSELDGDEPAPVVQYPDRTLHEIDEHVTEREAQKRAYEEAEHGQRHQGFSCSGKQIADGDCK